ncbi:MAG: HAD family hydrolase [Candidatus Spyradocola sp.]
MWLFIDLFYTLCSPVAPTARTEWDALGIPAKVWLSQFETEEVCIGRELGLLYDTPEALMRGVLAQTGLNADERDICTLTDIRVERMRRAVTDVRPEILRTLDALHDAGHRLCLVSNADLIDTLYWHQSPLAARMDETVFSHLVHARKPDEAIYRIALERTGADPARSFFIGDGGSNEHHGAKRVGLRTLLVTHLRPRPEVDLAPLLPYVDARTDDFTRIPDLIKK